MIPKKIHYCWLSDDAMPEQLVRCVDSWKKYLPDYEIVKWDLKRFPLEKNIWVKEAFESKKYAFAADYIRLYALATEGGIYLDSDVEVIKSFDDLMCLPYFICQENSPQGLEAATIGAEPKTRWIEECLSYYSGKHFIDKNGNMQTKVLPAVLKLCINKSFKFKYISKINEFDNDADIVCVFPCEFFSPKSYVNHKIKITNNTYSIHHFAGTWQPTWKKILLRVWVPLSIRFPYATNFIKKIIHYGK